MNKDNTALPIPPEVSLPAEKNRTAVVTGYLLKAVLWCLLVLGVFEFVVRLTFYSMPVRWVYTNHVGEVPVEGSILFWAKEGLGWTRYQPLHELATPYEGGTPVIVLGDSHTEAWQVPEADKFASAADTALHEAGSNYDIRNFGFSSAAMGDYVSLLPLYINTYHPAAVVVQITTDDFSESFWSGKQNYYVQQDGVITDLIHSRDLSAGTLQEVPGDPPELTLMFKIIFNERLGQIKAAQNRQTAEPAAAPSFNTALAREQLDQLVEACGETPLILVLLPYAPNIAGGELVWEEPGYEQLVELARSYPGVTVVDPYPEFVKMAESGSLPRGFYNSPIPSAGHLNIEGNRLMGLLLAEAILEALP